MKGLAALLLCVVTDFTLTKAAGKDLRQNRNYMPLSLIAVAENGTGRSNCESIEGAVVVYAKLGCRS